MTVNSETLKACAESIKGAKLMRDGSPDPFASINIANAVISKLVELHPLIGPIIEEPKTDDQPQSQDEFLSLMEILADNFEASHKEDPNQVCLEVVFLGDLESKITYEYNGDKIQKYINGKRA